MVSIIIPTKNRNEILRKTLKSYVNQEYVTEIIIIQDGTQDSKEIINEYKSKYDHIDFIYIKNRKSIGAFQTKILGVKNASNNIIMFGEDDAEISFNYVKILYEKIQNSKNIGIVSGVILYLKSGESFENAVKRYKITQNKSDIIQNDIFILRNKYVPMNEINVPFTHALYMVRKETFLNSIEGNDIFSKGNGYREETIPQLNILQKGFEILLLPQAKCFHYSVKDIKTGGQRKNRFVKLFWTLYLNHLFINKYYDFLSEMNFFKFSKSKHILLFDKYILNQIIINPIQKRIRNIFY